MEAVRERLKRRLGSRSARWLAQLTGYPEKNVQRYVSGESDTIPADFIGACEVKGFAAARWLLTEEGTQEPQPVGEAERTLELIRRIVDPDRPAEERHALLDWGVEALAAAKAAVPEAGEGGNGATPEPPGEPAPEPPGPLTAPDPVPPRTRRRG